jgi:uncharacterized MAPEG superfamily protein
MSTTRVFAGKGKQAHGLATERQGHPRQNRYLGIRLAIRTEHLQVDRETRAEVVAQTGVRRRIRNAHHPGKAWQVVAAGELGVLAVDDTADYAFHLIAIWLPVRVTALIRCP